MEMKLEIRPIWNFGDRDLQAMPNAKPLSHGLIVIPGG